MVEVEPLLRNHQMEVDESKHHHRGRRHKVKGQRDKTDQGDRTVRKLVKEKIGMEVIETISRKIIGEGEINLLQETKARKVAKENQMVVLGVPWTVVFTDAQDNLVPECSAHV